MRKNVEAVGKSAIGRTLVFPIAALDFLVFAFLNFTFEDPGTLGLVEASDFKYLRGVKPRVRAPAHDCDVFTHPARTVRPRTRAFGLSDKLTARRREFHYK
jgi:hypothetical protein